MDINRCGLDDISRPASTEQTGSRVSLPHSDRIRSATPVLLVLTDEDAYKQIQSSSDETTNSLGDPVNGRCQDDDEGMEDFELQRAMEEMRRLDEILSDKISKGEETKRQRRKLNAKLWQDFLQNKPEGRSECALEALNTRLFLALEAPTAGTEEEGDFVPVFTTQAPECDHNRDQNLERSESETIEVCKSFEVGHEETGEEQCEGSQCGASKRRKKQKDFVKRNIKLVSGEEDRMVLTQAEKERLAQLLQEIDEEDSARGADSELDVWAESVLTGQGYTPAPSELRQLIDIDSKIHHLLPVKEFLSVQGSYTNLSLSQGQGSEVAWKCDEEPQPGEKVLQDIKMRGGLERRLREIQQQLEILGQSQEMTDESPDLTEEQLLGLLDECEQTDSWTQDLETYDDTVRL